MNQNRSVTSRSLLLSALLLPLVGVAQAALIATSAAAYAEPHTDSLTAVNGPTGSLSSAGAVGPLGVAGAQGYGEAAYGALHSSALAVDGGDGRARAGGSAASTDNVTLSSSFIGRQPLHTPVSSFRVGCPHESVPRARLRMPTRRSGPP